MPLSPSLFLSALFSNPRWKRLVRLYGYACRCSGFLPKFRRTAREEDRVERLESHSLRFVQQRQNSGFGPVLVPKAGKDSALIVR